MHRFNSLAWKLSLIVNYMASNYKKMSNRFRMLAGRKKFLSPVPFSSTTWIGPYLKIIMYISTFLLFHWVSWLNRVYLLGDTIFSSSYSESIGRLLK